MTRRQNLPGKEFESFGIRLGLNLIVKGAFSPQLLLNPVSCVRYFEFDFVKKNLGTNLNGKVILDVASPYLFGLFICSIQKLQYQYINLNQTEVNEIKELVNTINYGHKFLIRLEDAIHLPYPNNSFDHVISISVIEHINGTGDSTALTEMWRVLKPGGKLILTFPIKKTYKEEFRDNNAYGLIVDQKEGKYFFQRFYDHDTINKRLLSILPGYKTLDKKIFGEIKEGFFQEYEKRWIIKNLSETVKDPYYVSRYMKNYSSIDDLPGIAVMGITLVKL